jgi:hypothetical protein
MSEPHRGDDVEADDQLSESETCRAEHATWDQVEQLIAEFDAGEPSEWVRNAVRLAARHAT